MFLQCNSIYTNVYLLKILKSTALYCVVFLKFSQKQTELCREKTGFCLCENKDADQLRGNREADQRLFLLHR